MLTGHKRAALQFSGGKDSTALLLQARPWLDRITVYFVNTGVMLPEQRDFVQRTIQSLNATVRIIQTDVAAFTEKYGTPADIVPLESTFFMAPAMNLRDMPPGKVVAYSDCCGANIWHPLMDAIRGDGHTLVLRGNKACDSRRMPDMKFEGIEFRNPLWTWSDEDVFRFLAEEGVALPPWYSHGCDSFDCWLCTAHLPYGGAPRLAFLRRNHPGMFDIVKDRLRTIDRHIEYHARRMSAALEEALED